MAKLNKHVRSASAHEQGSGDSLIWRCTTYLESVGTAEVDLEDLCTERRGRGRVGEGGTGIPVAREIRAGRVGAFPSDPLDDDGRVSAIAAIFAGDVESGEVRKSTGSRRSRVII